MVTERTPTNAPAAAPAAPVTVQVHVWGNGNEVHVDGANIREALSCQGRSSFRKQSPPARRWYQRLVEIAERVAVRMGNEVAVLMAWLSLLGSG